MSLTMKEQNGFTVTELLVAALILSMAVAATGLVIANTVRDANQISVDLEKIEFEKMLTRSLANEAVCQTNLQGKSVPSGNNGQLSVGEIYFDSHNFANNTQAQPSASQIGATSGGVSVSGIAPNLKISSVTLSGFRPIIPGETYEAVYSVNYESPDGQRQLAPMSLPLILNTTNANPPVITGCRFGASAESTVTMDDLDEICVAKGGKILADGTCFYEENVPGQQNKNGTQNSDCNFNGSKIVSGSSRTVDGPICDLRARCSNGSIRFELANCPACESAASPACASGGSSSN